MGCHYGNSVPSSRPSPEIRASPAPSPSSPEPRKSNSPRASSESSSSSSSSGSRSVVMGSEAICTSKAKRAHARQLDRPEGGVGAACVRRLEFLPSPLRETSCFSADRRCSLWPCPGSRLPRRCRLRRHPRSRAGTGSCPARSRPGALWSSLFPRSYECNTMLDETIRNVSRQRSKPKPAERVYFGNPPPPSKLLVPLASERRRASQHRAESFQSS